MASRLDSMCEWFICFCCTLPFHDLDQDVAVSVELIFLYRSPHLLEVRERIRINGRPLSRKMFVSYFEEVYSKLHHTRHLYEDAMPSYFRFLTVMAFYVFLQSKVSIHSALTTHHTTTEI